MKMANLKTLSLSCLALSGCNNFADQHFASLETAKYGVVSASPTPSLSSQPAVQVISSPAPIASPSPSVGGIAPEPIVLSFVTGDFNNDGTADISDVVGLSHYLSSGGKAPVCRACVNLDNSYDAYSRHTLGITDLILLTQYLYNSRNMSSTELIVHKSNLYVAFTRGDVNLDGKVDISDVSNLTSLLYYNDASGTIRHVHGCARVLDVNADGAIDISDVVSLSGFLFGGSEVAVTRLGSIKGSECKL